MKSVSIVLIIFCKVALSDFFPINKPSALILLAVATLLVSSRRISKIFPSMNFFWLVLKAINRNRRHVVRGKRPGTEAINEPTDPHVDRKRRRDAVAGWRQNCLRLQTQRKWLGICISGKYCDHARIYTQSLTTRRRKDSTLTMMSSWQANDDSNHCTYKKPKLSSGSSKPSGPMLDAAWEMTYITLQI